MDHVKTLPTPPAEVAELPISEELNAIVMTCLEKDPRDRFQTATELAAALEALEIEVPWDWEKAGEWWDLHSIETESEELVEEAVLEIRN